MAHTKKRDWQAVRFEYSPTADGWSECSAWHVAKISDPDVCINGSGISSIMTRILTSQPAHWVMCDLNIDGRIMMAYLMHNGWTSVSDSPKDHEFNPLISDDGRIVRIRIRGQKGLQDIDDLQRLVPMSLQSLRDVVTDGDTDWRISDNVNVAARMVAELNRADMTRITLSSNAYNDYLDIIGRQRFRKLYPVLDDEVNQMASDAFSGGFVWLKDDAKNKHLGPGISVDCNSLYPYESITEPLPVGRPHHYDGKADDNGMLHLQTAVIDWVIKSDGWPVMPRKYQQVEGEPGSSCGPIKVTMTDVDWQLVAANYDIAVVEWAGGYEFYGRRHLFDDYVSKWGGRKQTEVGGQRLLSKLMLVSLLGKFGTRTKRASRSPIMDEDGHIQYVLQKTKRNHGIYTPLAAWITAYGRRTLLNALNSNRDRVVYADTDGMHLIGSEPPKGISLSQTKIGDWKIEKAYSDIVHLREKSYMWTDAKSGETQCKVSGMPENIAAHMTYEDFRPGWQNWNEDGIIPGLERWLPIVDGEKVRMVAGKYRIGE